MQNSVTEVCSQAILNFSNGIMIECDCNPSDVALAILSSRLYNRLKNVSTNIQKTVEQINKENERNISTDNNLRFKSKRTFKCKSKKSILSLEEQPITRSISSHLQEVNATRNRYRISGGSPLKWMWDKNEFHRPLTKEDSFRFQYGVSTY